MNKNQNGFGHIEILIISLVIVVVGSVGFFVWHRHAHNSSSTAGSAGGTSTSSTQISNPTATKQQAGASAQTSGGSTATSKPTSKPTGTSSTQGAPAQSVPQQSFASGTNVTDDAGVTVIAHERSFHTNLEVYYINYGYYPSDLNQSNFPNMSSDNFTQPSGTKIVYVPTPSGCSTSAQNCQHYTISAERSDGTVLETKTSDN